MENDSFKWFFTPAELLPEGVGYGVFTPKHFALLAVSALLIVIIAVIYRRADRRRRILIRRIIAAVLVVAETIYLILMHRCGGDITYYLPLEICSFGIYAIVVDAIWPDERFLLDMMLLIFMPGALMALIFPVTVGMPVLNYFTLESYTLHTLIAAYGIARFAAGELRVSYRGLWSAVGKTLMLAAVMYVVDILIDRNYMFLLDAQGNFMLGIIERTTGKGVPYLIGLVIFTIAMIHVFFAVFKALEALFLKNGND